MLNSKTEEYFKLMNEVFSLIKREIGDDRELVDLLQRYKKSFFELPECDETMKTLKGIRGFYEYLKNEEEEIGRPFVLNSMHDLIECIQHREKRWFSPRTSSYVEYYEERVKLATQQ